MLILQIYNNNNRLSLKYYLGSSPIRQIINRIMDNQHQMSESISYEQQKNIQGQFQHTSTISSNGYDKSKTKIKNIPNNSNNLTQDGIQALLKLFNIPPQSYINNSNINIKLQKIFQYLHDSNPQILQTLLPYIKLYIVNGVIQLTNQKYSKYFQKYIFTNIREAYPQEQKYMNFKKENINIDDNKITDTLNNKSNDKNLNKNLLNITKLLVKQKYQYEIIDAYMQEQFITLSQTHNQFDAQKWSLWELSQQIQPNYGKIQNIHQNIILMQYYGHILSKLLDKIQQNSQNNLYIDIVIDGWLFQCSRQYLTRHVIDKFQQTNIKLEDNINYFINSQQQKIYKLVQILDLYIQQQNRIKNSQKQDKGFMNNWVYIKQYCINNNNDNSKEYRKHKVRDDVIENRIFQNNINNNYKQISSQYMSYLSPSDIFNLVTCLSQHHIQINNPINNNKSNSNMRQFCYLHTILTNQQQIYRQQYITNEIQVITQQLINNSYPTTTIICDSYNSLTNIIYELHKLDDENCNIKFGKQIRYILGCVWKQISKVLWQQQDVWYKEQQSYNNNMNMLTLLANTERLLIFLEQMYSNNINININQNNKIKINGNNDYSLCEIYQKIKICNMLYSYDTNIQVNLDDISNVIKSIENLIQNKQNLSYAGVFMLQLLQYCININQHIKCKQQFLQNKQDNNKKRSCLLQQTLSKIQTILYCKQNSENIYSNALLYCHRIVSTITKGYLLLSINEQKIERQLKRQGKDQLIVKFILMVFDRLEKQQKVISYLQNLTKENKSRKGNSNMKDNIAQKKQENQNVIYNKIKRNYTVAQMAIFLALTIAQTNIDNSVTNSSNLNNQNYAIYQQLIIAKSSTLQKCLQLLSIPSSLLSSQNIVPLSHSPRIYNLHQYNNIAIKFNELLQHNTHHRELVSDSDFYRNHCNMYIYIQCIKIYMDNAISGNYSNKQQIFEVVFQYIKDKLSIIKNLQSKTVHNSAQFYQLLSYWQYMHAVVYYQPILFYLTCNTTTTSNDPLQKQYDIIDELLQILCNGYIHSLVRQYVSVIISKIYNFTSKILQEKTNERYNLKKIDKNTAEKLLNKRRKWRQLLISKLSTNNKKENNININISVPVLFTLGYQMIRIMESKLQKIEKQEQNESQEIFDIFIKFISCHHAYIRTITQYYIMKAVQLKSMHKNSIKAKVKNNNEQHKQDSRFLQHLCLRQWKQDKDCIKIMKNISIAVEGFKQAMNSKEALQFLEYERVEECPSQNVIRQMRFDLMVILDTIYKRNNQYIKIKNLTSKNNSYLLQNCIRQKINFLQELNRKYLTLRNPLILHYKLPNIIIIASLLQKVHNFGYILRTLHGKQAMLLVPSHQLLQHPECQQFIPCNSQIEVILIKINQLDDFIKLFKKRGYPLIGLQQCAGSIKIQQYKFPNKYMLLLGNQRIGAPASLLNKADALVEIPQVGKVRSLNVHVSMVVCLWQNIINSRDR